uniref:Fatty acyl-CoA reductase n=1 Tax=Culicoides sonorensis TaxID=179676 RepID=A0A336LKC5_CULSO
MWLILLLIIFVLFFINIEIKRIKITKKYGHIKGSKEYPIVGNITSIKYHQLSDFNLILNELCPEPISKVTAFGKVMFVISDPTVAQTILSSPVFHKRSFIFKFFEMQNALFTTDYETWKPLRKGVNGAFNKKGIATMAPVFNKHIDGLCNAIEKEYLDRDQFDIYKIIAKFEINKVVETMLNVVDYNSSEYLVNTLQDAMDSIGERIFNPIYYPDIIFRFTSACAKLRKGHSLGKFVIQEVFGDSFEDKRKHFEENNNNNISKKIFIDELLKIEKEGQYLSYDEVVDNFKTIVMSGFETQSLAMGWIILMLAMFSETDQKVYQEICENYDESNHINEELVKKLAYLDMNKKLIKINKMSEVVDFYRGKSIFLTGGTGFIGQIIIEKLLRCCDVKEIFLLIRGKKDKTWQSRIQEILSDPVFDRLKAEKPTAISKLKGIVGDCSLINLGVSDQDRQLLIENVQIVIHGAATVKFDEELPVAMQINVSGTQFLIELSKQMKHLITFVYISTAYSNCNRLKINEEIYEPPITREQVENYMNSAKGDVGINVKSALLSGFPNTYALTKCLAEYLIAEADKDLPIVIFRPAIVMPTADEPVPGWINNYYGPIGIVYGVCLGVLHVFYVDGTKKAQLVPVDYCVNALLVSAWDRSKRGLKTAPIYNFVPKPNNMIDWNTFCSELFATGIMNPPIRTFGSSDFTMTSNFYYAKFLHIVYHLLPAFILDTVLKVVGHKFRLLRVYDKIEKLNNVLNYFSFNHFVFDDTQTQNLWRRLNDKDKKLFKFNMNEFDWDSYLKDMYFGMRKFMIKDDPSTIPAAVKRQRNIDLVWRMIIWGVKILIVIGLYKIFKMIVL